VQTCGDGASHKTTPAAGGPPTPGAAVWIAATAARGKHGTGSHRRSGYRHKCRDHARWRGFATIEKGRGLPLSLMTTCMILMAFWSANGRHVVDANTRSMPIGFRKLLEGKSRGSTSRAWPRFARPADAAGRPPKGALGKHSLPLSGGPWDIGVASVYRVSRQARSALAMIGQSAPVGAAAAWRRAGESLGKGVQQGPPASR
jgi:hypothetical protein